MNRDGRAVGRGRSLRSPRAGFHGEYYAAHLKCMNFRVVKSKYLSIYKCSFFENQRSCETHPFTRCVQVSRTELFYWTRKSDSSARKLCILSEPHSEDVSSPLTD